MTNHTLRIENQMGDPRRRRNTAEITITPPVAKLSEITLAAVGIDSANILISTEARDDSSIVHVEAYGAIAERTAAIHLLADRLSLLASGAIDVDTLSQDTPFSHEGWAALRDYTRSPDFSSSHPYYGGRTGMSSYTPRRLIES